MKVLLLTFYYPPDLCAGSFRAAPLVDALVAKGAEVDVITTMPNRYGALRAEAPALEKDGAVTIRRFALPNHNSGMGDQTRAFAAFARKVWGAIRGQQWDVVIATSSRLMTASLGAVVAKRVNAPLYLDIRDLFTDTMDDVLAQSPLRVLIPAFRILERWAFRQAVRINVVSEGFREHIKDVAPDASIAFFPNGIDDEFLNADFNTMPLSTRKQVRVLYAGNIGEGQGLHRVLPAFARKMGARASVRVIGDGGRMPALREAIKESGVANVELLPPVPRVDLLAQYQKADILFLHLNDYAAFETVLPSKIFEYAATGKPILAGVGGYAARFLEENVPGAAVFSPCDADAMVESCEKLIAMGDIPVRDKFVQKFTRRNIMLELADDIMKTCIT
ncbi:glycosyltransferase family 4 protein [Litorivivens sp.]|uniref:glycosyltransferase family 4 protein n=1 Tax=Litorivivens sp. TaxID=2020868 RepID=UPI003564237E